MTKLLILSSDTGEGHNSAAAAIESAAMSAGLHAKFESRSKNRPGLTVRSQGFTTVF